MYNKRMSRSMSPQSFTHGLLTQASKPPPAICTPRDHSGKGPWSSKAVKLRLVPAGSIMTPWGIFLKIASPTTPAETEKHEKWLLVGNVSGAFLCARSGSVATYTEQYMYDCWPCGICIHICKMYIHNIYKRPKPEKNPESASQRLMAAWWWRFPCVSEYQSNNPFWKGLQG